MLAKSGCERPQRSARACVRQSGVEYDFGRRERGKSKPFSNLDDANRSDTLRQRGDSETG